MWIGSQIRLQNMGFARKKTGKKRSRITLARLDKAARRVRSEMGAHGLWTEPVAGVQILLIDTGESYAEYEWVGTGDSGVIVVRAIATARRVEARQGTFTPLVDILCHEYAHALANIYKGLIRSRQFTMAFGASYDNHERFAYSPETHMTEYAATNASEDFAETFMRFLKHGGELPAAYDTEFIRRKWRFVARFCASVRRGKSRWDAA
jgi:hypothetical protein